MQNWSRWYSQTFLYFSGKIRFDSSFELSVRQFTRNVNLFPIKYNKNCYFRMSSASAVIVGTLRVNNKLPILPVLRSKDGNMLIFFFLSHSNKLPNHYTHQQNINLHLQFIWTFGGGEVKNLLPGICCFQKLKTRHFGMAWHCGL